MTKAKKKISLPRRAWVINPVTRVKQSVKAYSRKRARAEAKKQSNEE